MTLEAVRLDPDYLTSLELQLDQKEEKIKKLKQFLDEKEDLLLTTSEKLCISEKRKVELENIFLAPKLENGGEGGGEGEGEGVVPEDNFVSSNWRAARLETENNFLKRSRNKND